MTPLGKLNTVTVYVTVRADMSTTTTADPNAAVLSPGAGVSPAPVSVAFNVNVSAAAGAAWNLAKTTASDRALIHRHVIATLLYRLRRTAVREQEMCQHSNREPHRIFAIICCRSASRIRRSKTA